MTIPLPDMKLIPCEDVTKEDKYHHDRCRQTKTKGTDIIRKKKRRKRSEIAKKSRRQNRR